MSFYLIDDLDQGTAEWHEWRKGVIGSSEAQMIMGENRWKGRQQLLDEKLGLVAPFSGNAATQRGHDLEPHARKALENKYKIRLTPVVVQDIEKPFLAASLDAINSDGNQIYEIKCGIKTYETVSISGVVPNYYTAQVQHMLMVTQMESMLFAAYSPGKPLITLVVNRNDKYIKELRQKEISFVNELKSHGHKVQREFRGRIVKLGVKSKSLEKLTKSSKSKLPKWKIANGLLRYWDGTVYIEGNSPGFAEVAGGIHYWNGEEWFVPKKIGPYDLNGQKYFWSGANWE